MTAIPGRECRSPPSSPHSALPRRRVLPPLKRPAVFSLLLAAAFSSPPGATRYVRALTSGRPKQLMKNFVGKAGMKNFVGLFTDTDGEHEGLRVRRQTARAGNIIHLPMDGEIVAAHYGPRTVGARKVD